MYSGNKVPQLWRFMCKAKARCSKTKQDKKGDILASEDGWRCYTLSERLKAGIITKKQFIAGMKDCKNQIDNCQCKHHIRHRHTDRKCIPILKTEPITSLDDKHKELVKKINSINWDEKDYPLMTYSELGVEYGYKRGGGLHIARLIKDLYHYYYERGQVYNGF